LSHSSFLTEELHILPYFHGNRSPRADPTLHGMITGLSLASDENNLALLYLATLQSLAHGTRHIIAEMNKVPSPPSLPFFLHKPSIRFHDSFFSRVVIESILYSLRGDLLRAHYLFERRQTSQAVELSFPEKRPPCFALPLFFYFFIIFHHISDAVLLGSAILGAVASRKFDSILSGMKAMNNISSITEPSRDEAVLSFHNKKHAVFLEMYKDQMKYRQLMGGK